MEILNLKRMFEALKMNDFETIKEFMSKLMKMVNQIRLLGEQFLNELLKKVLVVLLERFEPKISSLEGVKRSFQDKLDRACKCSSSSRTKKTSKIGGNN